MFLSEFDETYFGHSRYDVKHYEKSEPLNEKSEVDGLQESHFKQDLEKIGTKLIQVSSTPS